MRADLGSVVESLEIGKTKILFRKVKQLDDTVEEAIREEVAPIDLSRLVRQSSLRSEADLDDEGDGAEPEISTPSGSPPGRPPTVKKVITPDKGRAKPTDLIDDWQMRSLLETNKEMALIRIGIEIELVLADLERRAGLATSSPTIVWSRTMRNLQQSGVITPQISKALTEFRNVRNQLIHPSGGAVPEPLVTSAVDSGLKLLRLLSSISDMSQSLPVGRREG